MTKGALWVSASLIAALAVLVTFQHRSQIKLREQNEAMQRQLEGLLAQNASLSNNLSEAGNTPPLEEGQSNELLRLRNEVATLRKQTNGTGVAQDSSPTIDQVRIVSARWGSGTNVMDVTARVIELLHREPSGFAARVDWLKSDPAPYKNKTLLITYDYSGRRSSYIATGGSKVTYDLLLANAGK